ncbi:MAG TPA: diacylglycerol kinase [Cryomorphaceae bacterium]|nr:diacylglycerol kinase [Owenweeksia sp.]MBF98415.1 diacylglycerol kinase [Owenweeksia sp.]HAD96223.1 diacylglycerol kinase [Cryomorphaceae bacterium]HBF21217.1 diacylglycerol kinase [Cryomorphaceae bacterium]|tara:strand:- start:133 stop:627 length:495 start_codon:yes stop_codon:yes gene_type:complete
MNLTLIAAMAQNRVIGNNNDLIWHLPRDMKHFRELTTGHHVIMGRKTFESMDGRPLKNRTNILITRQEDYQAEGCIVVHSLDEALASIKDDDQPFVIGGAEIYRQALEKAQTLELTLVYETFEGDTHFPELQTDSWKELKREHHTADEKNSYAMDFVTYVRSGN